MVGVRGADVKIKRKGRVRWIPPVTEFTRRAEQWMVQQMVYTGPWPTSYRVTTLFGEVLWSLKIEADHRRQPMVGPHDIHGQSITSSGKGCTFELNYDEQIIALAERAHKAFPDIPLLGIDLLKDYDNGRLYVIEVNAIGFVWHFSSPRGLKLQKYSGINLESQFDGIRKAARILAKKTREHAY